MSAAFLFQTNFSYAQISVTAGTSREDYRLNGPVKTIYETHWDDGGLFLGRQYNCFSRTGKVTEETVFFGEDDNDIESVRLYSYNSDGSVGGIYTYTRGGEDYAVLKNFSHWIADYDKKGHLLRKRVFGFESKTDKYGSAIWRRTHEEVFISDGSRPSTAGNDTVYEFDKKTGLTVTKKWYINELDFQGEGRADFSYNESGDTVSVIYDDPTGRMPSKVEYEYKYASKRNAEKRTQDSIGKGNAVSPILEKRKKEAAKNQRKQETATDTMRLELKTVTTRYTLQNRTVVRSERYDDSSMLVNLKIEETHDGGIKETQEWRWTRRQAAATGRKNGTEANTAFVNQYQLTETETIRHCDGEMTYQVKDRFAYDRNGDPISRTRSGKSVTRPATWRFTYRDYDDNKNWTRRTYSGPATETIITETSPKGNPMQKISYEGTSSEEDTRIIKYY